MGTCFDSFGMDNGSRRWILLLWTSQVSIISNISTTFITKLTIVLDLKTEKCVIHDLPQYDDHCCCLFPGDYQPSFAAGSKNDSSLSGSSGASLWLSVKEEADSLAISVRPILEIAFPKRN